MTRQLRTSLSLGLLTLAAVSFAACGDNDEPQDGTGGSGASSGAGAGGKGGSNSGGNGGHAGNGDAGNAGDGNAGAGGDGPLDAGGRVINITPERYFPEGVTVDNAGNFYVGSMELGSIYRAAVNDMEAKSFIEPDDENGLVSVIGVYADDATDTLWACSSDAGNGALAGKAPAAIKQFKLSTGEFVKSFAWPAPSGTALSEDMTQGVNGFCNDLTVDADGNLYATDSWYPRVLRLAAEGDQLEEWVWSAVFPSTQWHLNGIDIDQTTNTMYVVENHPGALYSIPIKADGKAGTVTKMVPSRELKAPDGLKVLAPNLLVTAEGGNENGGISLLRLSDKNAEVEEVIKGFDQVATFALYQASAWVVENQADHFWGPTDNGPNADPPFRLVEVPLAVGAGGGIITMDTPKFFPEGVTHDGNDNFYIGSMDTGAIHRAAASDATTTSFIEPDDENGLVSVIGVYADETAKTLWACSSDAGNGQLKGKAPAALVAFDLETGELKQRFEWPVYVDALAEDVTNGVNGFCNDITVDDDGNVYATDSWYPRILRLPAGATDADALQEWVVSDVFPQTQWHLNGIDIDRANKIIYAVENHPGALYSIPIKANGGHGTVTEISTSRPLYAPDGLKVIDENTLAIAEGAPSGMATIDLTTGVVRRVSTGLDGIATFALREGSAWLVENQGDHFWGMSPDPVKPFRLVEVPMNLPK